MFSPGSRRHLVLAILSMFALSGAAACSGRHTPGRSAAGEARGRGQTLTLKGSDTMVILAQRWAEAFMQGHGGASLQVSGGGSGTGIAALLNGTTDIATSSRPMKSAEREKLETANPGRAVIEHKVAIDALAIYVHQSNPLRSISMPALQEIYRGRVPSWRGVGGREAPIVLYSRENNSGTYAYFKEHVLDDYDFAAATQTLPGTAAVINAVARDPNGIGYGGIAYAGGVRSVPVLGKDGTPVPASLENATSGEYPLARFLYMYTVGEPEGITKTFLDWVKSDEGQGMIEGVGFYPIPLIPRAQN